MSAARQGGQERPEKPGAGVSEGSGSSGPQNGAQGDLACRGVTYFGVDWDLDVEPLFIRHVAVCDGVPDCLWAADLDSPSEEPLTNLSMPDYTSVT